VISSSQGLYLYTNTEERTPNIHALSEIRSHDPGFRESEDSTCLRQLGYRDRSPVIVRTVKSRKIFCVVHADKMREKGKTSAAEFWYGNHFSSVNLDKRITWILE
jgi:hypothetical protein